MVLPVIVKPCAPLVAVALRISMPVCSAPVVQVRVPVWYRRLFVIDQVLQPPLVAMPELVTAAPK